MNSLLERLKQLEDKAVRVNVDAIRLPTRVHNVLAENSITNAKDALLFILNDLSNQTGIGVKSLEDARAAAGALIFKLESCSEHEIDQLNDPREVVLGAVGGNLVDAFPAVVEIYHSLSKVSIRGRNQEILIKRFGLDGEKIYTLEEIGLFFDVTRERIRQIEEKSIRQLGELLSGDLNTDEWRLPSNLNVNYGTFRDNLKSFSPFATELQITDFLVEQYGAALAKPYLSLLMETCGYVQLSDTAIGFRGCTLKTWFNGEDFKKKEIQKLFSSIDPFLSKSKRIPLFDVLVEIKRKTSKKFSNDEIISAISIVTDFECSDDHLIVRFDRLSSAADKAYRILESSLESLHFSKIIREINLLSKAQENFVPVTERNLQNQMVSDPRFTPVGKSGEWGLSERPSVKNITIAKALQEILHKSGKPMQFLELKKMLMNIRPDASERSIKVYLHDSSLFTRTSPGTFGLKKWRLPPAPRTIRKQSVSREQFGLALKMVLAPSSNTAPMTDVVREVMAATKLSEASVRQRIKGLESVELRPRRGRKGLDVYCADLSYLDLESKDSRITLRERVQTEIKAILYEIPNQLIKKGDLYKLVVQNMECGRSTFYSYLSEMAELDFESNSSGSFVRFFHHESKQKIRIDFANYSAHEDLIGRLARPVSKLTVDEVDIALYELGLQFENTLKDFLTKLREKNPEKVFRKDLSQLSHMIDCAVREKVVSKGYHLNTLREERNQRAHGAVPSQEEREELFNKAHYIADLFIRYICFFDGELRKI